MAALTVGSGISSSSICGQKLAIKSVPNSGPRLPSRVRVPSAKYGEKSIYFDLGDISNTTGNWDLYGSDGPSPYNGLQSKFFELTAGAFTKRGLLLKFLVLGGAGTIAFVSSNADPDVLPIKKGPQQPPQLGPGGKI